MSHAAPALGLVALLLVQSAPPPPSAKNPFSVFGAAADLGADDLRDLRAGRTVVRVLDPATRFDVGVFVAARISVTPAHFVARVQNTAALWQGEAIPATGMFSQPARIDDVASLSLARKDVDALRECRPGDCLMKLTAAEIERVRAAIARRPAAWRDEVQREFRQIVVDRVQAYRHGGPGALQALTDHATPVELAAVFSRLSAATHSLATHAPQVAAYLEQYPRGSLPAGASEHFYWLYTTETPRPTVQVMHVVVHPQPHGELTQALVVSRQILASHYVNGALAVTALVRDPNDPSGQYLVYLNRSEVDGLSGVFSTIRRFFVERRIRGAARSAFERLRGRIVA